MNPEDGFDQFSKLPDFIQMDRKFRELYTTLSEKYRTGDIFEKERVWTLTAQAANELLLELTNFYTKAGFSGGRFAAETNKMSDYFEDLLSDNFTFLIEKMIVEMQARLKQETDQQERENFERAHRFLLDCAAKIRPGL